MSFIYLIYVHELSSEGEMVPRKLFEAGHWRGPKNARQNIFFSFLIKTSSPKLHNAPLMYPAI